MKKRYIILLGVLLIINGCSRHMHMCHNNRYNQRPHPPGRAGNYSHDLSIGTMNSFRNSLGR